MLESLFQFILAAHNSIATVYGYSESYCGVNGAAVKCEKGAVTSSGEIFDPEIATMALAVPNDILIRPTMVVIRIESGPCRAIRLNDRKNENAAHTESRWDLTPAAILVLGGKPTPTWSGRIYLCFPIKLHNNTYDWQPKLAVRHD